MRNLVDMLVIGLSAALRGWTDFERMEAQGQEREAFFKGFFELPRGIPDACAFNRAFSMAEPAQLLEAMKSWYTESGKNGGRPPNNHGKTIRGSASKGKQAVPMVMGQKAYAGKAN